MAQVAQAAYKGLHRQHLATLGYTWLGLAWLEPKWLEPFLGTLDFCKFKGKGPNNHLLKPLWKSSMIPYSCSYSSQVAFELKASLFAADVLALTWDAARIGSGIGSDWQNPRIMPHPNLDLILELFWHRSGLPPRLKLASLELMAKEK